MEVIRSFMRFRNRITAIAPEEMVHARHHLAELMPPGHEWGKGDFGLFLSMGALLRRQQKPMTMGELSQALDVPLSTATRIVDQLVKHEYAERLPDPGDRRVVRVGLTTTGVQMYEGVQGFFEARVRQFLRYLEPDEQETLLRLLHKLHDAVEQEISSS
jgi:DNA-binding MarR family transcriptional regulator